MNTKNKGFITILVSSIVIGIVICIYIMSNSVFINIYSAKSAFLRIEEYNGMKASFTELEDNDTKTLKSLLGRSAWLDTPSCPCYGVEIIFRSDNNKTIIYPAGDGCRTMRIEKNKKDYYFYLSDEQNIILRNILKKYGVKSPFGI